jgi:CBS domain-containing protein
MSIGRICTRTVAIASADEAVAAAARRMAEEDVGTIVVLGDHGRPAGILTDRDLVLRVVARGLDPAATAIDAAMTRPVVAAHESTPIEDGLRRMARAGVRRLVVIGDDGRLVGVLALDDVLALLVEEAGAIGRVLEGRGRQPAAGPER